MKPCHTVRPLVRHTGSRPLDPGTPVLATRRQVTLPGWRTLERRICHPSRCPSRSPCYNLWTRLHTALIRSYARKRNCRQLSASRPVIFELSNDPHSKIKTLSLFTNSFHFSNDFNQVLDFLSIYYNAGDPQDFRECPPNNSCVIRFSSEAQAHFSSNSKPHYVALFNQQSSW